MSNTTLSEEFIDQAIFRLNENTRKIEKCLDELSEEEIWKRPNKSSNSVGNLILHLCGNVTQYIISSLGEKEDNRNRDFEFKAEGGYNKSGLIKKLTITIQQAFEILREQNDQDQLKIRSVQGFNLSGTGIILHVVEHYSYHTGQIIFWTKLLKDIDLEFYAGVNLDKKNRPGYLKK